MKLSLYTHDDLMSLAKAIIRDSTGINYPFSERTFHKAIIDVIALFGARASGQTIQLAKHYSLEFTSDNLLDRRGLENDVLREEPAPARVAGIFRTINYPTVASSDLVITPGTQVSLSATSTQSKISFYTEAVGTILTGSNTSNELVLVCTNRGISGNNITSGTSLTLDYPINGVGVFYTSGDSGGGLDRQTASEYRASIRNKRKSLGECTWLGIESLAKTVKQVTGNRVIAAKIFENFSTGINTLYIDDGSGSSTSIGPIDITYSQLSGGIYWNYTEASINLEIQLPTYHLPYWTVGSGFLQKDTGSGWTAQSQNTDYFVNIDTGKIVFASALNPGDKVRAKFDFYGGLVAEVAENINGILGDSEKDGWRPAGNFIQVRPPTSVDKPTVSADIIFNKDSDSQFGRELATTFVVTYLNSLDIGEVARYGVISKIISNIPGVDYVDNLLINSAASDYPPTSAYGVVRGLASNMTF